jgi:hypothetical protein
VNHLAPSRVSLSDTNSQQGTVGDQMWGADFGILR